MAAGAAIRTATWIAHRRGASTLPGATLCHTTLPVAVRVISWIQSALGSFFDRYSGAAPVNTLYFRMPTSVAAALRLDTIKRRARGALVTDVRFDYDLKPKSPRGHRIACSTAMAIFLVEELGLLAAKARARRDKTLTLDCSNALTAAFKAIEESDRARRNATSLPEATVSAASQAGQRS